MKKELVYVGDPVCSWCYAFTDSFEKIKQEFKEKVTFSYLMGGLVIDRDIKIDSSMKQLLKKNWREVHTKTGKYIKASEIIDSIGEIPYISDEACKGFVCAKKFGQEKAYSFYKNVHKSFYTNLTDISDIDNLCEIAQSIGIEKDKFLELFNSHQTKEQVYADIKKAKDLGVRAFPALVAIDESGNKVINQGVKSYDLIRLQIESWIRGEIAAGDMFPVI